MHSHGAVLCSVYQESTKFEVYRVDSSRLSRSIAASLFSSLIFLLFFGIFSLIAREKSLKLQQPSNLIVVLLLLLLLLLLLFFGHSSAEEEKC